MTGFRERLAEQRWDDHRFYHHSLVNQSLHFISASTFICAYILLFHDPAIASLLGWCIAMTTRQAGHFFFEPKGYDQVNDVTHAYKEDVKVGYNLARKWVLMTAWALAPVALLVEPTFFGLFVEPAGTLDFLRHLGIVWLLLAVAGLLFRIAQLCVIRDVPTGLTWGAKILTDPFNDFRLYRKAPIRLARGERVDETPLASRTH
jgi:hypothetical protein